MREKQQKGSGDSKKDRFPDTRDSLWTVPDDLGQKSIFKS